MTKKHESETLGKPATYDSAAKVSEWARNLKTAYSLVQQIYSEAAAYPDGKYLTRLVLWCPDPTGKPFGVDGPSKQTEWHASPEAAARQIMSTVTRFDRADWREKRIRSLESEIAALKKEETGPTGEES